MFEEMTLRFVKLFNTVAMAVPFAICWFCFYALEADMQTNKMGSMLIILLFLVLYVTYGRIYDAFLVSLYRISEMIYSQMLSVLISDGIMYVIIGILMKRVPAVWPIILVYVAQIVLSVIWCLFAHKYYYATHRAKRTVIVYDRQRGIDDLINEYGLSKKFDVQISVSIEQCIRGNLSVLEEAETVFICGVHSHDRNIILKKCIAKGIDVYVLPRIGDVLMSGAKQMHMFHLPMLRVGRYHPTPEYLIIKRVFDIVSSGILLLLVSPVMLVTAIVIKATDGGPVLYKQRRLTKDGKTFEVLKFRSMRVDAEKDGIARLSTGDKDERITPVGHFIRKMRIDELPQLLNILKGEMSVVGPRPERPEIAEQYMEELPEFALRLQAKAGLTGYAQVYGKYNTTPYDKLQMDLMYISRPSFVEDMKIIFATIKILFTPESTEGVSEGQMTAAVKNMKEDLLAAKKEAAS